MIRNDFIKKCHDTHGELYDYSLFDFVNQRTKGIIICKKHKKQFEQSGASHLQGHGCPLCGKERIAISNRVNGNTKRLSKEIFVERAKQIHEELYNYDLFEYIQSTIKGLILCQNGHEFKQSANMHLLGHGCPKCAKKQTANINRLNEETKAIRRLLFIEKAKQVHGNLYDYDLFEYCNATTKGKIICKIHTVFEQSPNTHIQNHGCPLCGQHKSSISNRYTTEEFVARAKLSHDEKYDYSKVVYKTEHENIVISCPIHKEFEQTPNNHLYGLQGCPKCTSRVSKPETLWLDYLNIPVRQHSIKTTIRKILVDGYDPETNTVYQFHGNYWHGNPDVFDPNEMNKTTKCTFKELYDKTQETDQLIRESGYNLVVIWEKDWRQLTTKME